MRQEHIKRFEELAEEYAKLEQETEVISMDSRVFAGGQVTVHMHSEQFFETFPAYKVTKRLCDTFKHEYSYESGKVKFFCIK